MKNPWLFWILLAVLAGTNLGWSYAYHQLWYAAAEAEGHLDQAETYIHAQLGQRSERTWQN
jgi:hypothetical protein